MPRRLLALLAFAVALAALPAGAHAKTVWLCSPHKKHDPCDYPLKSTVVKPDGSRSTERTAVPRHPKVDCFYVYPTVSDQKTVNATLHIDPEQKSIAIFQASRFSQDCRVWAPMYRQLTLGGIFDPTKITPASTALAYNSLRAAWRDYIRHDNHGRGVVLLGHSQGSFVLRQIITDEIDNKPAVRHRLISALLLGGNTTSKEFRHVHPCTRPRQFGCIVAWSSYHDPPPANSRFARTTLKGQHVVCTSPGRLGGSSKLVPYEPTIPFVGTIGAAISVFEPSRPTGITTPWFSQPGHFTAACASTPDGAHYLKVDGEPQPTPVPDATWGLHLGDVNLALGNLTTIVRKQATAYLKHRR